jgi:ParB family chromosome partitioning protein
MGKLRASIAHAGMNSGAAVLARMTRVSELKTDPALAGIFAVKEELLEAITRSMRETGYDKAEPVVIWKGRKVVVDGHTRLKAAIAAGITEIPAEEKAFPSLEEAKRYAYKRQAERRNLTQAEIFAAAAELGVKEGRDGAGRGSEILGKELGVAPSTIQRARKVAAEAPPEIINQVKQNKMSINKAYQRIKKTKDKNEENPDEPKAAYETVRIQIHTRDKQGIKPEEPARKIFEGIAAMLQEGVQSGMLTAELYEDTAKLLTPLTGKALWENSDTAVSELNDSGKPESGGTPFE